MPKKLTARQLKIRVFANEYVRDFNGARAAAAAGWSAKRAAVTASELLDDAECQAELEKVMQQRERASRVKAFKVLEELAVVAFSNLDDYNIDQDGNVTLKPGVSPDAMRAVSKVKRKIRHIPQKDRNDIVEIDVEIALWSKPDTLRMAGQHLGLYKEIVETRDKTLEDLLLEDDGDDTPPGQ